MGRVWFVSVSLGVCLFIASYVFLGSQNLDIYGVWVEQNGQQVNVSLNACIVSDSLKVSVDEHDDRVVIHIEGNQTDSDCSTQVSVSLDSSLKNRKVVVGSPKQTFEFCGSDTLCRE